MKSAVQVDAGNTKLVGQTFAYRLTYNCSSTSGPCLNAEVDDLLPAEVQFSSTVPASPSGDIAAINVTPNFGGSGRTRVQFVFVSPLTAGNSGDLLINVQFPGATAAGTTAVNTADGINLGTSPGTFTTPSVTVTAKAVPTVTAIAPTSGSTLGGTAVTITGTQFTGTPTVTIGGNAATGVTVVNGTTITATTAAHAAGAVDVVVTTPGGTGTGAGLYTYVIPPPTVTAITPNTGSTLGGSAVTIAGSSFTGATAVTIGGSAATGITVINDTTITATTPAHGAGAVDVVVTTAGGPGTGTGLYTYSATFPTITSITPNSGSTLGGTSVTVTGTNLTGATAVAIGGTAATGVNVVNATTLTATTPAHAAGAVDVTATTPGGTATRSSIYTYATPAPVVTAIAPSSGTRLGGTAVTITGISFTGATAVTIGGVAAAFAVVNDTTITATTPAHAPGVVDVAVTTPSGPGIGTGLYTFAQTSTSATLTSSLNPATVGQAVTFAATISSGSGTPTGTVTFLDGTTVLGSAALSGGTASLTVSTLTAGVHSITAVFSGSANFAASTSAALAQSINVPADSTNLRALQIAATKMVAQGSGQAISGAIDNAISDGFSGNQPPVLPSGSGLRFNFGTEAPDNDRSGATQNALSDPAASSGPAGSRVDHAFSALASIDKTVKAPPPPARPREWMAWADVQASRVDQQHGALAAPTFYGGQINALAGLTHRLAPDFLVGVLGGYETFDYRSDALVGRLKGDGWTVGSYLGWRILPGLRFDAAAAYSGIGYDGTAGTAAGTFGGKRLLVTSGLTGSYLAGGLAIEPSAKVYALWERQGAYVDSLGTSQAEHSFATGRASGGVKLIYPVAWTSSVGIAPYAGLYADYYFTRDDAAVLIGPGLLASQPFQTGWSARAAAGIATSFANGAIVTLGGEYGGIGSHTQLWNVRGRASVPF